MPRLTLFLSVLALAVSLEAATLYDNTTIDTFHTLVFSTGPYDAIGDQIQLVSAGEATLAHVQLYNAGSAGTFDAILRFYAAGGQLGGDFLLTDMPSAGNDVLDLTFGLGGLPLPGEVVFLLSIANASAGTDLGVNLFEPPTAGSSDNTFLVVDLGGIGPALSDGENVYFRLEGTSVPEPSTLALGGLGVLFLACRRSRIRSSHELPATAAPRQSEPARRR